MIRGIDTATRLSPEKAQVIKTEGFEFVGRYLVPTIGSLKWKALTKAEAENICKSGLNILTVYETTANRAGSGEVAGIADGQTACKCARDIDMPDTGVIYFAVDFCATSADMDAIEQYLKAAQLYAEPYQIGVYGSYDVIEEMAKRKACNHFWQCVGWSYGRHSNHRNIYQAMWQQAVAGIPVDINECADMAVAGIWTYEEENMDVKRFKELWHEMRAELQDNDASEYSAEARDWAVSTELIRGAEDDNFMWEDVLTREQLVTVLYRFAQLLGRV